MRKILKILAGLMLVIAIATAFIFLMTERGVFEREPIGVEELREAKEAGDEQ